MVFKFLIIQMNHLHKGDTFLSKSDQLLECFSIQRILVELNHICDVYGYLHDKGKTKYGEKFNLFVKPDFNNYDFIIIQQPIKKYKNN